MQRPWGKNMLEMFKNRKRSFVYTHFPQEGAHSDPWSTLTHSHIDVHSQAVPRVRVLGHVGLHPEHGFLVLISAGKMETGGERWVKDGKRG